MQRSSNIVSPSIRKYDGRKDREYAKIFIRESGNNSFLASSTTFDVFDAMDCSRDVQRSNNFEFYRAMDGECVDRSFEAELTNDMRKKFRKGWRKRRENVAKMPSAKRISKWKRILCPLHRRLYGCLRSSKQQFDIASSNPGCRLLNVGVCKKNWICKFFRDFCRLKRKI